MERRKIAIVSDWYLPRIGGLELHLRDLARELLARGHDAHIITATPGPPDLSEVRVHRLDVPLMPGLATIRDRRCLAPLQKVLEHEKFDVVHCHTALSPLAHAGMYLAAQMGIPCVFTEHSVLRHAGVVLLRALDQMFRWSRWPGVLSAVSSYVADDLRQITGHKDIFVLPNGINLHEWQTDPGVEKELRITTVMRLTKRKRPHDVVRAIPRIHGRLPPDLRPRFTIVGDGPQRGRVERDAHRLDVTAHLDLLGFRPRHEIRDILSRSTLFILPTSKEALSIATLEARCAGLPVVAMNHGGVGDLIRQGQEGFLANTYDEFIDRIVQVMQDPALRERMARKTRESLDRFSWNQVIAQHLQLYRLAAERSALSAAERVDQSSFANVA